MDERYKIIGDIATQFVEAEITPSAKEIDKNEEYAKFRIAFWKAIARYQAIQMMIADTATEIEGARLLLYRAASMLDRREKSLRKI